MAKYSQQGYALLIGVTGDAVGGLALPMVGRDMQAVQRVLTHPERCAYPVSRHVPRMAFAESRASQEPDYRMMRE